MSLIHNVGSIAIDPSHITSALQAAVLHAQRVGSDYRGPIRQDGIIDAYARHRDGEQLRALAAQGWTPPREMMAEARRADAALGTAGAFPRDLEYVRRSVLEEPMPVLNAERLFGADTEVPLGATSHVMHRWTSSGEAQITRGSSSVPIVSAGKVEERFPVHYVVCAVARQFFQRLSIDYAGLQTYRVESQAALRAVRERLNRIYWGGDVGTQLRGVLNYPHLTKGVSSIVFDSATNGIAMVAELARAVGTPRIVSKQTMFPNRIVVSETMHQLLFETPYGTATDTSVGEYFLRGQVGKPDGIRSIEAAYELEAGSDEMVRAGAPAGYHGILAYRDDMLGVRRVVVQEPTWLPTFQNGPFDEMQVMFAATGGVVMPNVGNNVLVFARVT